MPDPKADMLHPEDWKRLKRFMTGQIQNVLANEWGIGGQRKLKNQIESLIRAEFEATHKRLNSENQLLDRIADRIAGGRFAKKAAAKEMLQEAIETAVEREIEELVRATVARITLNVNVSDNPDAPGPDDPKKNPNYGAF